MASQKIVSRDSHRVSKRTPQRCAACPKLDYSKQSWIGVNLDIEERNLAEFCLAEGQRLAHMGSWAFDPKGFYYWSPELFRIHGLDPASKPPLESFTLHLRILLEDLRLARAKHLGYPLVDYSSSTQTCGIG